MTAMDRELAELFARQHGLVTRSQALRCGLSSAAIGRRLAAGQWDRVHPSVYRLVGTPPSAHQRVLAGCLGSGGVASHRSAAWLWGLDGPFESIVEVTVPRHRRSSPRHVVVHRSTNLEPGHVASRRGVPVTNPLRTLVDLGAVVPRPVLDRAVDDALARRLVTLDGVLVTLGQMAARGRCGVADLRASLAERTGAPESVLEAEMERLLVRSGLPEPVRQYEVYTGGRFVARLDFAFPQLKLAVEVDGASTRVGREALERDDARQNSLVGLGWVVLRFTWCDVVRRPEHVLDVIVRMVASRSHELGLATAA